MAAHTARSVSQRRIAKCCSRKNPAAVPIPDAAIRLQKIWRMPVTKQKGK
jgi:hypothetical protein